MNIIIIIFDLELYFMIVFWRLKCKKEKKAFTGFKQWLMIRLINWRGIKIRDLKSELHMLGTCWLCFVSNFSLAEEMSDSELKVSSATEEVKQIKEMVNVFQCYFILILMFWSPFESLGRKSTCVILDWLEAWDGVTWLKKVVIVLGWWADVVVFLFFRERRNDNWLLSRKVQTLKKRCYKPQIHNQTIK